MSRKRPVFLAREGYRRRRAIDAARFLPILGAVLILLPTLLIGSTTRAGMIYIFTIWVALIIGAAVLSRRLTRPGSDEDNPRGDDDGFV